MRVTIVTNIHLATTYRGGGWWCALLIPRQLELFNLKLNLKSAEVGSWESAQRPAPAPGAGSLYATAFCPAISPREGKGG